MTRGTGAGLAPAPSLRCAHVPNCPEVLFVYFSAQYTPGLLPRSPSIPSDRLPAIEGLRFLLALFIVLHHVASDYYRHYPSTRILTQFFVSWNENYAVNAFFFLAGFVFLLPTIAAGYRLRQPWDQFINKRTMHLLVSYYLGILWSLTFIVGFGLNTFTQSHWDMSLNLGLKDVLYTLFGIANYLHRPHPFNYSYWFLVAFIQMQFFLPLLLWQWRRWGALVTTLAVAVLSYVLQRYGIWPWVQGIPLFALVVGMLAADIAFGRSRSMVRLRAFPWRKITLLFTVLIAVQFFDVTNQLGLHVLLGMKREIWSIWFFLSFSVASAMGGWVRLRSLLAWKPFVALGGLSYSMYLVHAPLVELFQRWLIRPLHVSGGTAIVFALFILLPIILLASVCFASLCDARGAKRFLSYTTALFRTRIAQ